MSECRESSRWTEPNELDFWVHLAQLLGKAAVAFYGLLVKGKGEDCPCGKWHARTVHGLLFFTHVTGAQTAAEAAVAKARQAILGARAVPKAWNDGTEKEQQARLLALFSQDG